MNTDGTFHPLPGDIHGYGEYPCLVNNVKQQIIHVTILITLFKGERVLHITKNPEKGVCFSILLSIEEDQKTKTTFLHIPIMENSTNGYLWIPTNIEVTEER